MLRELDYELDILCVLQRDFSGLLLPPDEMRNWAVTTPESLSTTRLQTWQFSGLSMFYVTPRTRLLESISLILDRLSEEDWDLDKKMTGWELGDSLVLLPPVLSAEEILNNDLVQK